MMQGPMLVYEAPPPMTPEAVRQRVALIRLRIKTLRHKIQQAKARKREYDVFQSEINKLQGELAAYIGSPKGPSRAPGR